MSHQQKSLVFVLSFLCMASRHSCLEGWYVIKPTLTDTLALSSTWLGAIDTMYLFCYSIGLYVSGILEDGYSMKLVISIGMVLASLLYYFMVVMGSYGYVSPWFFLLCWGLQGFLQSTVWPGAVSLIGNWFPKASHGGWMGLWSCNSSIGNIIGAQVALLILGYTSSWEIVMLSVSSFMLISAILTYFFVQDRPQGNSPMIRKGSINFWKAWKLPGVMEYSFAYGCIKMLNYSMMMWLPYYLVVHVQASNFQKIFLITLFDLAGIGSSAVAGVISDKINSRVKVIMSMLVAVMPVFIMFRFGGPDNIWIYYILIPLSGSLIVACSNLVTTCVATDLAHHTEALEHTHAMATVTGIIDGTGSLGAACGQIFIGWIQIYSWNYVFYFMVSIGAVSILILLFPLLAKTRTLKELECKFIDKTEDDNNYN